MSPGAPRVHLYGAGEAMLAFGPQTGPQLLVLQPLFEEMNRARALIVAICRALGERGIGCWLPDLPGTGESLTALDTTSWQDWCDAVPLAVAAIGGGFTGSVGFRGGVLLDHAVPGRRWRFAPTACRSLLSDLRRSALASGSDPATPAGYHLAPGLTGPLSTADVGADDNARTIRLVSDDRPADRHIEGVPVWRRPEPEQNLALARLLSDDIAIWAMA